MAPVWYVIISYKDFISNRPAAWNGSEDKKDAPLVCQEKRGAGESQRFSTTMTQDEYTTQQEPYNYWIRL